MGPEESHPESAEKAFSHIEKIMAEARTLRLRYDWGLKDRLTPDPRCGARRTGSWGSLILSEPSRLYYENWGCSGSHGEVQHVIASAGERISQGRLIHSYEGTKRKVLLQGLPERDLPKDVSGNLRIAFARAGFMGVSNILGVITLDPGNQCPRSVDVYRVSDFGYGRSAKGNKCLTYKLSVSRDDGTQFQDIVSLWYDPNTYKPVSRSMYMFGGTNHDERSRIVYFEDYEELVLNEEVSDNKFRLPTD